MNDGAQFSEADLAPSPEERAASRRSLIDRVAASVAALAAGAWVGGIVALGACAAPFVFRLAPAPFSGDAMSAAFARFDQFALGAAVILLGAEVARTWAAYRQGAGRAARVRRVVAMVLAGCAAYVGLALTPRIAALHREGVRRGEGELGMELERVHRRAELVSKSEVFLGASLVLLHVFTLGARRPEQDDDEEAAAPLPPGPR
ncbi:DUF4149 domain-containing protein [Sorangium sp. So ce302]|uniref:DUF4149 domain-containing protein n=1 Tax=unclassified Sorangium TaxID=2621164 RepID=UPI003F60C949